MLKRNVVHWFITGTLALVLGAGLAGVSGLSAADDQGDKSKARSSQHEQAGEAKTVDVEISETKIDMEDHIEAGQVEFEIKNGTSEAHTFVIERTGSESSEGPATDAPQQPGLNSPMGSEAQGSGDKVVEQRVQADGTQKVQANLSAGTYRVFCPDAGHDQHGMALTLTVVDKNEAERE